MLSLVIVVNIGCGGDEETIDIRPDGATLCRADTDCDDGIFCNGLERCVPGPGSDFSGCVSFGASCRAGQTCDEQSARCETDCSVTRDADGDGSVAVECGGDDCDDSDPTRFPGNLEVCDPYHHDEDCDPTTYGDRDLDGDGHVDSACCNRRDDGEMVCGSDCDDLNPARNPGVPEICNGIDDNCNGLIDEGFAVQRFYRDADGDFFGDPTSPPADSCAAPFGFVPDARDCDDTDPDVHPLARRRCDGVDNACDGVADLGCPEALAVAESRTESPAFGRSDFPTQYRSACPSGEALVGVDVYVAACVDLDPLAGGLRGVCAPIDLDVEEVDPEHRFWLASGEEHLLTPVGCVPGTPLLGRCPPGSVVSGFSGNHGSTLGRRSVGPLRVFCSRIELGGESGAFSPSSAEPTLVLDSGGREGDVPFEYHCPEGSVATGIRGHLDFSTDPTRSPINQFIFECSELRVSHRRR